MFQVKPIKSILVTISLEIDLIDTNDHVLERIKAKEIISEAFLQVARIKPDDPIDFLYS